MREIGSYKARVHFGDLLRRVERDEALLVTMHGRPVAHITRAAQAGSAGSTEKLLIELDEFRAKVAARGPLLKARESLKDLAREGAKWSRRSLSIRRPYSRFS